MIVRFAFGSFMYPYANGETARYNNAVSLWNNGFLTYRDYCCRRETPEGRAKALRLC